MIANRILWFCLALLPASAGCASAQEKLVLEQPETMALSMFRAHWDKPVPLAADGATAFWDGVPADKRQRGAHAVWSPEKLGGKPGALAFDALNRGMLVRFPGAAERIAAALRAGKRIARVELVLPFKDEELFAPGVPDWPGPDSYNIRANWGIDNLYLQNRPTWHAVAWALRRPWVADAEIGPTFNAAINGAVYWTHYGAGDEKTDRFAHRFGPAEVSHRKSDALDVTPLLADTSFGPDLGTRLRVLSDSGFLVKKWETYDHRYFRGVYEFATATGGRAILIHTPRLEVTFAPAGSGLGTATTVLPPAPDVRALAGQLKGAPQGRPTAVIPPTAKIEAWARQMATRPEWMDPAQWQRVQELMQLGGRVDEREPLWVMFVPGHILGRFRKPYRNEQGQQAYRSYATPEQVYTAWVDGLIARQTRGWSGFETANEFAEWQVAKDVLPGPARDAVLRYWTDWMMPGRPTAPEAQLLNTQWLNGSLVHPMADQLASGSNTSAVIEQDTYWKITGDWRGNKSFFRSGFNYAQSTQNFNTTAATGAYIFGNLVGAPEAVADGKVGVDRWLLKGWIWSDGTGQEHFDHYYYAVTLKGLKALQNSAQDDATRLIGDSLVTKGVEEALLAWHPNLKRFIAPSSRTSLNYLLGTQEGGQYLMHALSSKGALTDTGVKELPGGYPVLAVETPPALVALLSLQRPWVSRDMAALVDSKPLPWEASHSNSGQWRRTYFGRHYGLASSSTQGGRIQAMAQWRRTDAEVTSARQLGTLDMRMGINETNWANNAPGWIYQPGKQVVAQAGNAWLAVGSPTNWNGGFGDGKTPVRSVQHSIGLFDLSALEPGGKAPWEIYVAGQKVENLPFTARAGQPIVIRDGVTHVGIIPLAGPDMGRDAEVVLAAGAEQKFNYNGKDQVFRPGLVINSYIVRRDTPLDKEANWYGIDSAYTGFAVQFGDASEGTFAEFSRRMHGARAVATYDAATRTVSARYQNGATTLEFKTETAPPLKPDGTWSSEFASRLLDATFNGRPLYPEQGTLLDTPLSAAAWNRVEKLGATLTTSTANARGSRLFLQSSTDGRRFVGWNPQGRPADLQFSLPDGMQIRSDGMLGLARLAYDTASGRLDVDHAFTDGRLPGGSDADNTNASALLISGAPERLQVTLNGKAYTAPLERAVIGTATWRVLPLTAKPRAAVAMKTLLERMDQAPAVLAAASPRQAFLHVNYAGPFPQVAGGYGPEQNPGAVDLQAVYAKQGEQGEDIKWRNWGLTAGAQVFGEGRTSGSQKDNLFMFRHHLSQSQGPCTYYLHAAMRAGRAQDVRLKFTLSNKPQEARLWLNGRPVPYDLAEGGVRLPLRAGENQLLIKVRQDAAMAVKSRDAVVLALGEPVFGLPLLTDVEWRTADGSWVPATPRKG